MGKRKQSTAKDADRKANASLRKRGRVWWTHFGFKGQFFRFSLGTSDRSKAKREAKKLIALAVAGKISAVARTPADRKARRSASLKRSNTDPRVSAAAKRRNAKRWKNASEEDRKAHGAAIAASVTPARRRELSETTAGLWKDKDYRTRIVASQSRYWAVERHRKEQSGRLLAAGKKLKVQENRRKGKLTAARNLLRRRGVLKGPGKRGRKAMATTEREFFKHGLAIEMSIPAALRADQRAIEDARVAYSDKEHLPLKLCGTYHRRFRAEIKENPSLLPDEVSSR